MDGFPDIKMKMFKDRRIIIVFIYVIFCFVVVVSLEHGMPLSLKLKFIIAGIVGTIIALFAASLGKHKEQ